MTKRSRNGLAMPLSRHSVEPYQETSSHAICHGTFDHSCLSSLCHCGLILAYKSGFSVRQLMSTLKKEETKKEGAGGE